jgi:ribose transport system ATP-binding protein
MDFDARALVEDLSVARQQMVEIAKALSLDARVIIMDEPTSALTERETATLFEIIGRLKAQGVAIVYITHRLEEIFRVADLVTVLRDGQLVGSSSIADTTPAQLISQMVGRELTALYPKQDVEIGEPVLEVSHLRRAGVLHDVSFVLHRGEILGLAGLVGAGRTELVRALFGADPMDGGDIRIAGKPVHIRDPRDAIRLGLGFVTEDRKLHGLILGMSLRENTTLASLPGVSRFGFINFSTERKLAADYVRQLDIRTQGVEQEVVNLSGGNQQKVVIAKWLATQPRSILMISSELPEILGMSDRILVVRQGRISAEFTRQEASQEKILAAAA